MQYGVLGAWTASLVAERYLHNKKMDKVVENNTIALTKVHEVMTKCQK
jgi:hypothetical protein